MNYTINAPILYKEGNHLLIFHFPLSLTHISLSIFSLHVLSLYTHILPKYQSGHAGVSQRTINYVCSYLQAILIPTKNGCHTWA